jgi:uncharacterized protein (TIGR03083 family)
MAVTPDLLSQVAAETQQALEPYSEADWTVPARDLEWTCRQTAVHLADDYFSYAAQVVAQPVEGYLPIEATVSPDAEVGGLLASIAMCAGLLSTVATAADPSSRAWHPMGTSDPYGWVAMGMVEGLVHTYDIAGGLGSDWRPPAELCRPVIERLFPEAPDGDASDVLLWCTGRAALGDRPRRAQWRWSSAVRA